MPTPTPRPWTCASESTATLPCGTAQPPRSPTSINVSPPSPRPNPGSHRPPSDSISIIARVLNCWFDAVTIAVVSVSSWFVQNTFYWPDGPTMAGMTNPASRTVTVTLFDPNTYEPHNLTANIANESTTEDTMGGCWWHDAITQAALQLGATVNIEGIYPNSTFVKDSGATSCESGLSLVTGYPAQADLASGYSDVGAFFDDINKANNTPIVVSTVEQVTQMAEPKMWSNHGYPVLYATDYGNGTRTATLRNAWGVTDEFQIEDVWKNTYYLNHLTDWKQLNWPRQ